MTDKGRIRGILEQHGLTDFKWVEPQSIVVSQWVRLKCVFGCPSYGKIASCPPNTPTVEECRRFFDEYSTGLVIHFQQVMAEAKQRQAWSARINANLSKLERDVFLAGHERAFILFMDSCHLCAECVPARVDCKEPKLSRPSPEGMAVDVFSTVRELGFPIDVLTEPAATMNRYSILLID